MSSPDTQCQPSLLPLPSGRNLSYHLSGPATSPIILLSNPLLTNLSVWDPLIPSLHSANFRTLRYDTIGHGSSTPPPLEDTDNTTFHTLAADILSLLTSLNITTLHAFIGVSLGGSTGIILAAENPGLIQNLIVCDTGVCAPIVAHLDDPFAARVELARINYDGIKVLTEQTLERWFSAAWRARNAEETERMRRLMRTTSREGFIACCHALRDRGYDLRPVLGGLGGKVGRVMFLVGGADANLPEVMKGMRELVVKGVKGGERGEQVGWVIVKDSGHLPMIDNREEFLREVLGFLESG
ncbi:hypothetical protein FQN51_008003 [Onygenales sp. PD_10]|nr:hypothetical protein FQN51_008003 [Onygenales sp. PD_10]